MLVVKSHNIFILLQEKIMEIVARLYYDAFGRSALREQAKK